MSFALFVMGYWSDIKMVPLEIKLKVLLLLLLLWWWWCSVLNSLMVLLLDLLYYWLVSKPQNKKLCSFLLVFSVIGLTVSQALTRSIQPQQQAQQQQQQFTLTGQQTIQPQPQATLQHKMPVSSGDAQINAVSQMQQAFQSQYQQSNIDRQQQQQRLIAAAAAAALQQQQQQQQVSQNRHSAAELVRQLQIRFSGKKKVNLFVRSIVVNNFINGLGPT